MIAGDRGRVGLWLVAVLFVAPVSLFAAPREVAAESVVYSAINEAWERTDWPVASGAVSRTWMWGPIARTPVVVERYDNAGNGRTFRYVQYFDKSRMEVTDPHGDPASAWFVTNGLLVVEMVTGRIQMGDNSYVQHSVAQINVAGDAEDSSAPTYASFKLAMGRSVASYDGAITQTLARSGTVSHEPKFASYSVVASYFVPETAHWIAAPFWNFMTSNGTVRESGSLIDGPLFPDPFYATGFPISEPYWTTLSVGGEPTDVLIQCFERRCLTYTPSNPEGWKVEAGNVGQHYYRWRYGSDPSPQSLVQSYAPLTWIEGFTEPHSMAIDRYGRLYVADGTPDSWFGWVSYIDRDGEWKYISGIPIAQANFGDFHGPALFSYVSDVAVAESPDGRGTLLAVADHGNSRVMVFDVQEQILLGQWFLPRWPRALDMDSSGRILVLAGSRLMCLQTYFLEWQDTMLAPQMDAWSCGETWLNGNLLDVEIESLGDVLVVAAKDSGSVIYKITSNGTRTISILGVNPTNITFDRFGFYYVTDANNGNVVKLTIEGEWLGSIGRPGDMAVPIGIAVDASGDVYVADRESGRVLIYTPVP